MKKVPLSKMFRTLYIHRPRSVVAIITNILSMMLFNEILEKPTAHLTTQPFVQDPTLVESPDNLNERSANGIDVTPHEFPAFLVGISTMGCMYTLLRRRWGLTAAHCIPAKSLPSMPEHFSALAGAHNHRIHEEGQERSRIIKGIRHPHFNYDTTANDIALIKFETPFNFSDKIQPTIYPPKDYAGLDCVWAVGSRHHCVENVTVNCTKSPYVQKVDLPILSNETCAEYFEEWPFWNASMSFCAGYEEGLKSICKGDSGGPLYLIKDGKAMQLGITSCLPSTTCAEPRIPGVFTRVAPFIDWIEETIRKEEELDPTPEP